MSNSYVSIFFGVIWLLFPAMAPNTLKSNTVDFYCNLLNLSSARILCSAPVVLGEIQICD